VQALFWDYTPIVPPAGINDQEFYRHERPAGSRGPVTLRLDGLPAGRYRVEVTRTGYRSNDVFTGYLDLGSPSQLTRAQVAGLAALSDGAPQSSEEIGVGKGASFVRTFTLRQNDVYFVTIRPAH